jgi:hypothetical protein
MSDDATNNEPVEATAKPAPRKWPGNEKVEIIVGSAIGLLIFITWLIVGHN